MSAFSLVPEDLRTEDPRPTGPTPDMTDAAIATVRRHGGDEADDILDALGLLHEELS